MSRIQEQYHQHVICAVSARAITTILGAVQRARGASLSAFFLFLASLSPQLALAQDTVCARVKIEIKQELALERQAFEATMNINNTTTSAVIENVSVTVKMTDENGTPVVLTDDPNNLSAKFFIRVSGIQNIAAIDGTGKVNPSTTSTINWLIIPAPGAAGNNPLGKKYLVGATFKYRFAGEDQVLDVSPDVITVKPLPLLTLDYFLTQEVQADDPLTAEIEPVVPFTLGVRVKNAGFATAKGLKIDSAQPKITENKQGLLINFKLDGSYLNDTPVQNSLLIDFGDIPAATSKAGRWVMETTLAGKFVDFTARFSHSDELGGSLTSIMQATNAHFLIRDVRVDLPGRDFVRDFLAQDGDVVRVYESEGLDTVVTDRTSLAQLSAGVSVGGSAMYSLTMPPTAGFSYVKLPDPFKGLRPLGQIVRSDAKIMLPENVWLSKTRNEASKQWEYWVNFFDVNSTGSYQTEFTAPAVIPLPPVIQFVADQVVEEGKQVSFIVQSSSPNGKAVALSAAPLPPGATFTAQAPQGLLSTSVFDWTPAKGSAGAYTINYTASDGRLSATSTSHITVKLAPPPPVPATPALVSPLGDERVTTFKPSLVVQTGDAPDPATQVQFELYGDAAMSQLLDSGLVNKGTTTAAAGTTSFTPAAELSEDTRYWWRARAYDGTLIYSPWTASKFFVNTVNHAPSTFNLTSPAADVEVASFAPTLVWANSTDVDEDAVRYGVTVYKDSALTTVLTSAEILVPGADGSTSWTVDKPLTNHAVYYWRVEATDSRGATTLTPVRSFTVSTGNAAPTVPVIMSPARGGQTAASTTALTVANSSDADNDLITYVFELDTVDSFDSGAKQASDQIIQQSGASTSWTVANLAENVRYYWRAKAQDGRAESDWAVGNFLMNAVNQAPPAPTVMNPGNGAWVGSQQPGLEVNPVLDPEGDAVHYLFEVYGDAALTRLAANGSSDSAIWTVATPLTDKAAYYWRARAADPQGLLSAWSAVSSMTVSTAQYVNPTIVLTAPATVQEPLGMNGRKIVKISWDGNDPNIDPSIALYYGTANSGYAGTLIADGLKQAAGAQSGSYLWDVTSLPMGTYYIYAMIYDAKGSGRAYAAGAVVIAPLTQTGALMVKNDKVMKTNANGKTASLTVALSRAPVANVVVPLSSSNLHLGYVAPASLTFTPKNWNTPQMATVFGSEDCTFDSEKAYAIRIGNASSLDPGYIDVSAAPVAVTSIGNVSASTNNSKLQICGYSVVKERQIDARTWEYTLSAVLYNAGPALKGVTATLSQVPKGVQAPTAVLKFGAVGKGEVVKGKDLFILRASQQMTRDVLQLGLGYQWKVKTP